MSGNELVTELMNEEGFRKDVYIDPLQVDKVPADVLKWFNENRDMLNLTIGYGTLMEDISTEMGRAMLEIKLHKKVNEINVLLPDLGNHPSEVWDALYLMAYQMGSDGVMKFKKMIKALKEKNYEEAYKQGLDSLWARQTPKRAKKVLGRFIQK